MRLCQYLTRLWWAYDDKTGENRHVRRMCRCYKYMKPSDRQELEAILEMAKKIRDDPDTDPEYARVLDRWIKRDEEALAHERKD